MATGDALQSQRLRDITRARFALGDTAWRNTVFPMQAPVNVPATPPSFSPTPMSGAQSLRFPMGELTTGTAARVAGPAIPMGTSAAQLPPPPVMSNMGPRASIASNALRGGMLGNPLAGGAGGAPPVIPTFPQAAPGPPGAPRSVPGQFTPDTRAARSMGGAVNRTLPFGTPAGGVRAAAGQTFKWPGFKGAGMNALKIGLPIHLLRGATDDALSQGSLGDRFLEGAATGGELGSIFGPAGAAVGAAGVGLGDTLAGLLPFSKDKQTVSQMVQGLLGGGSGEASQPKNAYTFESLAPVFETAGIPGSSITELKKEYDLAVEVYKAQGMWDDTAKQELHTHLVTERIPMLMQEQDAQENMMRNQIAQQALVSQYFGGEGGIVDRMRQSGQARGDAMAALAGQLPGHLAPVANFMATDAAASSNSLATAYEAQIRMLPQMTAMTQYQQDLAGIASQVQQAAIQGAMPGASGATNPLTDPSALMAEQFLQ